MAEKADTAIDWKEESMRFNGVAERYDAYRPSYPVELIDTVIKQSGIQPDGRILEIGSGTGKATILFAQRGFSILGLDPGQKLIEVAAENLKSYAQVSFKRTRFEDWESGKAEFDLAISAQAFHWVPEEVRLAKTAKVLKGGGFLALFWNMYPGIEGELGRDLNRVYRRLVPDMAKPNRPSEQLHSRRARSLSEGGYFEDATVKTYRWSVRYEKSAYLGLLHTYSDHLRLAEAQRLALFGEIAAVIEGHGGIIDRPYVAALYMARKRTTNT